MVTTPNELLKALQLIQQGNSPSNSDKWRFVIYARKSTNDEEKQERSLPDQVYICQEFARNLGLNVIEVIQEAESAKMSDTRPKFREILRDISERGKYDGIIAWHPNRLARNMKDAGEIIDLLDRNIIKDLRFPSFTFENTTSGKMLLGMTFVLSKQYSDQLSDDVSRGNKRSIEEGRYINKAKQGYYKDSEKRLRPDGDNFIYIKKAFQLRLEGKTLDEIAEYLNSSGYLRWVRSGSHIKYNWDKQRVQKMMRDPNYTGVIVYGKRGGGVNLAEKYDFEPAVSVDDFMRINKLDHKSDLLKLARKFRRGEDVKANLMRGMVICGDCGSNMYPAITNKPKENKRYFYFRCENEECLRRPRSIRAKVITEEIYSFLNQKPFSSKDFYDHYKKEMERVSLERIEQTKGLLLLNERRKDVLENRLSGAKNIVFEEKNERIRDEFRNDIKNIQQEMLVVSEDIGRQEAIIKAGKAVIITYENFLELMEKLPKIIGSIKNMTELDFVIRKIFLNFTIQGKNVSKMELSSPFNSLYSLKMNNGGRGET